MMNVLSVEQCHSLERVWRQLEILGRVIDEENEEPP
jgi:hypothetical protein